MASVIEKRIALLEQRGRPRLPGLSSERRKFLTDRAVAGDQEALAELNLHRPARVTGSKEQREAAVAAARANA